MKKKIFLILLFFITVVIYLLMSGKALNYFISRSVKVHHKQELVKSYIGDNQYALYDQALAIIYYSHNDIIKARRIINQLMNLKKDGLPWAFSYRFENEYLPRNPNNYSGAQIWMTKALSYYQTKTKDMTYNDQIVIEKKLVNDLLLNKEKHLLMFSNNNYPDTAWNETEIASMEHNLDLLLFPKLSILNKEEEDRQFSEVTKLLNKRIIAGINIKNNEPDNTGYLDVYVLGKITGITKESIPTSYEINCDQFYLPKCYKFQENMDNIWYEGTFIAMIANGDSNSDLLTQASLCWYLLLNKGIPYSSVLRDDFSTSNSIAPLMWLWMWNNNILNNYK